MSWNGSSNRGRITVTRQGKPVTAPSKAWRFVTYGLGAVFALAVVALAVLSMNDEKPAEVVAEKPKKEHHVTEFKSSVPEVVKEEVPVPAPTNMVRAWDGKLVEWPPKGAQKDEQGVWRYPGGQMCFDPRVKPNMIGTKTRQIFSHHSENQIAYLLTAKPGVQFFGTMRYDTKKFKEDFVNALISPTEINEDDSDEDRLLKNDVRETMKDLAERVKKGEDLAEILSEARKELQRLGQYKQDLIKEVKNIAKDDTISDDEIRVYLTAANNMMESKGIEPIKITDITVRNIRRSALMLKAREEEKSKE